MSDATPNSGAQTASAVGPEADSRRTALLRAAISVVAAQGPRAATFRAVAAAAGVSNPLVAYYFGSREELLEAATRYATELALEVPRQESGFFWNPDFPTAFVDHLESWIDLQIFLFEASLQGARDARIHAEREKQVSSFLETYRGELSRERPEPGLGGLAYLVYSALEGIALLHVTHRDRARSEDAVRSLVRLLRN